MTVSELIELLSDRDPEMEVYVSTEKNRTAEVRGVDYALYSSYGDWRGVYIEIEEAE